MQFEKEMELIENIMTLEEESQSRSLLVQSLARWQ